MKVMKFGGTSIGSPQRMKQVADIIAQDTEAVIVVLSALSGTTNTLQQIGNGLANNERNTSKQLIDKLEKFYKDFVEALFETEESKKKVVKEINGQFDFLKIMLKISFSYALQNDILAQGELLSTTLMSAYLEEKGVKHTLLTALDFMQTDSEEEPLIGNIKVKLTQLIQANKTNTLFVTQGNICRNHKGETDNLKRGGSDYSASLIAAAMNASVCEIWTDLKGMHSNDPKVVAQAVPVECLSFEEAAELAYFSAKILHPASIWPAYQYNIPVRLLNIMEPTTAGTIITDKAVGVGVKTIAAKDNIIAINIKSSRMLLAYGFLKKIFNVFEHFKTPIDMVTTSEIAVSLTIEAKENLDEILRELDALGEVTAEENLTIIAIVGNEIVQTPQVMKRIFNSISDIPVRMVSYGGSKHNISLLIATIDKVAVMKALNKGIFEL